MQTSSTTQHGPRNNSTHGAKRKVLGSAANHVPPAWRPNIAAQQAAAAKKISEAQGSKIFISSLPNDVQQTEVEELFAKTVGPVKDCFVVYNSQGQSKGMAVVTFHKVGDAAVAKSKYDGRRIDGRKSIKIEIIVDSEQAAKATTPAPTSSPLSLLNRLAPPSAPAAPAKPASIPMTQRVNVAKPPPKAAPAAQRSQPPSVAHQPRLKKGPKRLKKLDVRRQMTAIDLDKEMDDYRASTA